MLQQNKRLMAILMAVPVLLLIPFTAMFFTSEVKWDPLDFSAAGILLLTAGLALEFILRKLVTAKARITACAVLFAVVFLLWAELAVGIFGTPLAGS